MRSEWIQLGSGLLALATLVSISNPAAAQSTTWTPTTSDFNLATNWSNGTPTLGWFALFNETPTAALRTLSIASPITLGGLRFSGVTTSGYTFSGGSNNAITLDNGGAGAVIEIDGLSTQSVTFNSPVKCADSGGTSVINNGTGVLRFQRPDISQALGALDIAAPGVTFSGTGNISVSGGGSYSALSGSGNITMNGAGKLSILSTTASPWTGRYILNAGTLAVETDAAFGAIPGSFVANALTFNGGTLAPSSTLTIHQNRGVTVNSSGMKVVNASTLTILGSINGVGMLTKSGTGPLALYGNNTYTGGTRVESGLMAFYSVAAAGSGPITISPTAAVTVSAGFTGMFPNNWSVNVGAGTVDIVGGGSSSDAASAPNRITTLSGNFSGPGSARLGNGASTRNLLSLTGDNSNWTGNVTISGTSSFSDTLISVHFAPQSFPTGNISLGAASRFASLLTSGALARNLGTGPGQFQWTPGVISTTAIAARGAPLQITFNGGNTLTWGAGGFVNSGQALAFGDDTYADNAVTLTNDILLTTTSPATRIVQSLGNRAVLAGNLLESPGIPGTLDVRSGTVELRGTGSTFTGGILVSGGRLAFSQGANLGPASNSITITSGGITYEGSGLTLNRTINLQPSSLPTTFDVTNPQAVLAITGDGSPATSWFYKNGSGTLDMQRPFSASVATSINSGTLALSGPLGASLGDGPIQFGSVGTQLRLDNTQANNNNRVASAVTLGINRELLLIGNSSLPTSEVVTELSFQTGGYMTLDHNSGPGVAITATQAFAAPSAGSFGIVRGPGLGTPQARLFLNTPETAVLSGIFGDYSLTGPGTFFVGYSATNGVVATSFVTNGPIQSGPAPAYPLAVLNDGTAGPSQTIGPANVIAGLQLSGSSPALDASSGSLDIASGMVRVLAGSSNARISGNTVSAQNPFRLFIHGDLTLDAVLKSTANTVVKFGAGTLHLARANAFDPATSLGVSEGEINAHGFDQTVADLSGFGRVNLGSAKLTIKGNSTSGQVFGGELSGDGDVTIDGRNLTLYGNISQFTGRASVLGGILSISQRAALMTTQPVVVAFANGREGVLTISENIVSGNPIDRMPNRPALDLASGTLRLSNGALGSTVVQEFGRLTGTGTSRVFPGGSPTITTFAGLDVTPDVGWLFQGTVAANSNLSNHTVKFTTPPSLSVTGGGAPGTNSVSIVSGVVLGPLGATGDYRFASYSPNNGLQPLAFQEMTTSITPTLNQNFLLQFGFSFPNGVTEANSLTYSEGNIGVLVPGSQPTFRIGSGHILINNTSSFVMPSAVLLDMNGQTGRILAAGGFTLTSPVSNTGEGGLVLHNLGRAAEFKLNSTDAARNTFSALTINGREVLDSSSQPIPGQLINASFLQDVNLGAPTGRITLNTARLTYAGTTPLTMNRTLRLGAGGAEVATTQTLTFSGPNTDLSGWGTLTKVGSGVLALSPRELAPGNYDGTPAALILNVPASAGSMSLALTAGSNLTWDLRGTPGSYLQDLLVLSGAVGPTLSIDPLAALTIDLASIDRSQLIADLGGIGASRDFTIVDAALTNTQIFAPGQLFLAHAPGFDPAEFSTLLVNGDIVLRFTPVPVPASVGILGLLALATTRRRR